MSFWNALYKIFSKFAEPRDKYYVSEHITIETEICKIAPPGGYKVAPLVIIGSAEADGDSFDIQTLQGGVWKNIVARIYLIANGHFNFAFPGWVPDQDAGDDLTETFRIVVAGTGNWSAFVLYALEEA